jgi:hypothetical protein
MSEPAYVRLRFDNVEQTLSVDEAVVLRDWLKRTHALAAQDLAQRLTAHLASDQLDMPFDLDPDEALSVRFVLVDANVVGQPELEALRKTLQDFQPAPGELS